MAAACLSLALPDWAAAYADRVVGDDQAGMRLAIELARRNVEEGSGGPFGAAIVEQDSGRLVTIGVNSVVRLNSSVMHAEMMAIMRAQLRLGGYSLRQPGHVLYASSDPCAMCLGGILWSGIGRLVCGAPGAAACAIGFDEGPVTEASYRHLERAGIEVVRGVLADEASAVIEAYCRQGGVIYNG